MSQVTVSMPKILMEHLQVIRDLRTRTAASAIECCVCGRGLKEGIALSARQASKNVLFYCRVHY